MCHGSARFGASFYKCWRSGRFRRFLSCPASRAQVSQFFPEVDAYLELSQSVDFEHDTEKTTADTVTLDWPTPSISPWTTTGVELPSLVLAAIDATLTAPVTRDSCFISIALNNTRESWHLLFLALPIPCALQRKELPYASQYFRNRQIFSCSRSSDHCFPGHRPSSGTNPGCD